MTGASQVKWRQTYAVGRAADQRPVGEQRHLAAPSAGSPSATTAPGAVPSSAVAVQRAVAGSPRVADDGDLARPVDAAPRPPPAPSRRTAGAARPNAADRAERRLGRRAVPLRAGVARRT